MNVCKKCWKHIRFFNSSLKFRQFSDVHEVNIPFSNKCDLIISSSKYAGFADGAAVVRQGDTSVLVTVVGRPRQTPASFLPLTVDYRQKAAAAGRIPTSHHRRDTPPTEQEILTSRVIDRSLRPLFLSDFNNEIQIICNVLAVDGIHDPEVLCVNAASTALALSNLPWNGPIGCVRVGLIEDKVVVAPTRRDLANSSLNMLVTAAGQNLVIMLEAAADDVLQPDFLKAIKTGVKECQRVIQGIQDIVKVKGKPKLVSEVVEINPEIKNTICSLCEDRLRRIFTDFSHDKLSRDDAVKELRTEVLEKIKAELPEYAEATNEVFNSVTKEVFRNLILETSIRCDGRSLTELRNISTEVDLYKPLHGSSLFQRGQTQVLCTVSLDSLTSALQMDPVKVLTTGLKEKNFFVHYEFPPYAVKEIGRVGSVVRREIGHGALAEKGIKAVVPLDFPFTIRLTSEVLQSNGKVYPQEFECFLLYTSVDV
uniref:polyribonucleotide nucleotidyltransferase n=1 Tax=Rhodnius prolixus TaxID=13249 RepID=T1HAV7_RHOPR